MRYIDTAYRNCSVKRNPKGQKLGWSFPYSKLLLGLIIFAMVPALLYATGFTSVTSLQQTSISASTAEKPQSKCWTNGGYWFSVLSSSAGTNLYRLDGTTWTNILHLSDATDAHADARAIGNVTHILLFRGASSQLVSVEYLSGTHTYQLWTTRPTLANITLDSGVETATIDIDTYGRMWVASDNVTDINVRWSDSPYSTWSSPITIGTGISSDDISAVTALPALGKVGVLWSNQSTKRFGFKTHTDGADPSTWSADEVPASQSAENVGAGMADDHLNVVVASDGTLYAAVKTSYDTPGYPKIALLIRRTSGAWDNLYEVDQTGTRGVVLINEAKSQVVICYTQSEGSNDIVYKSSALSSIAFGTRQTLMSGSLNEPSSTKQTFTSDVVVLASTVPTSGAVGVLAEIDDAGLVAYYMMNEGSGTSLRDTSSTGNHGKINGSPSWVTGMKGQGISFNGTSQYATVPHTSSLNITGTITLAAWIAPAKTGTQRIVTKAFMGSTNGYELSLSSAGKVFTRFNQFTSADVYRVNSVTSYPITGTSWIHAAATYAGDSLRIYINGVKEGAVAMATPIGTNTDSVYIGRQKDPANPYWYQGKMDEVHIYNTALSQSEIQALMNHTITATAGTGGVISPTGAVSVAHNGSQIFTITADPGYSISNVTVDGSPQGAIGTYTFSSVTIDHTINATFVWTGITHTITASAGANGSISPSGAVSVNDGGSQAFTITANPGYHVDSLFVDGVYAGSGTTYTFTNVVADHSISAKFAATVYPDLVGSWRMEEGSGTILADSSTYYNNGTILGTASWVTGMRGKALVFDGTTTYATVADAPSLRITNTITLAAWVKPGVYNTQDLIKKATNGSVNGYELSLAATSGNPPRRPFVRFNQVASGDAYRLSARAASEYPTNGTWVHYAATYDGTTIKFYINGLLDTSKTATFTIASNTVPLSIGAESNGVRKYTGQLDEVKVYNRALSAEEILALVAISTHTITASAGPNGNINPSGAVTVNDGTDKLFTITPLTGYSVDSLIVDGVKTDSTTSYTFKNVIANHTIRAVFKIIAGYTLRFAAIADYGINNSNEQAVANLVNNLSANIIITQGDNSYNATPIDDNIGKYFSNYIGSYTGSYGSGSVFNRFFPSIGNHDPTDGGGLPAYLSYFTLPGAGIASSNTSGNERYYDYVVGPVHFFAIDADPTEPDGRTSTSTQAQWLQAQLASSTSIWKIVYFHQSPYTSGSQNGPTPDMRWPFQEWGATAVISAHVHNYERILKNGFPYFVCGTGGNNLYGFNATPEAGSVVRYNANYGSMLVEANTDSITFKFYSIAGGGGGTLIDQYVIKNISFTITSSAGPNGTISPSGAVSVDYSGSQKFTITPNTSYHLDSLLVDGVKSDSTTSYTFYNVLTDHTIRAVFAIDTRTLTLSTNGSGSVVKVPDQANYPHGSSVQLTAIPAIGWTFVGWSGDASGTTNPLSVTMDGNKNITANFGQGPVGNWMMEEGSGTILVDSSSYRNRGTIFGAPSWVSGVHGKALVFNGTSTYVTVPDTPSLRITSAITIAAWVKPGVYATQDLIKKATNGSVNGYELSLASATGNPPRRPFVRFNQVASADNYRLSSRVTTEYPIDGTWMHLAATYDGTTIKMYINGVLDTTKAATFTIASNNVPLSIGAESNGGRKYTGQIDDARIYNYALSATEIHALWAWTHTITASAGAHGSVSPSGTVVVNDGANQSFTIAADPGYHITGVIVDGNPVGAVTNYTFNNVTTDHTISASFAINTYTLTVTTPVHGNVTLNPPGGTYDSNTVVQATAVPDAGYHFVIWSGDASGSVNPVSVTMNANKTITASFEPNQPAITLTASNSVVAGVNILALDGVDALDYGVPPPPPNNYVYLYFLLAPGQPISNFSQDIKKNESNLATRAKQWALRAMSDWADLNVTITLANSSLPLGFKPVLYDLQTGKYQDVRTYPSFSYHLPLEAGQISNFLLMIGDSAKPTVTVVHPNGGEIATAGWPDTIRWNSTDGSGILRHYVYYSLTGSAPYTLIDSTNGNVDSLIWTPGAYSVNARIKVVARDSVLNEQEDVSDQTFTIILNQLSTFTAPMGWNLISLPLLQTDMTPLGVFGDDYGADPYYLYQYSISNGFTTPSLIIMGQGYWLGAAITRAVDVEGIPLNNVTTPLIGGFNIIGDPFVTDEPVDRLRFTDGQVTLTMAEASASPYNWLSPVLYKYTGTGYSYETSALGVWKGYWIPILTTGISIQYSVVGGTPIPKASMHVTEQMTSTHWNVDLTATLTTSDGKICTDGIASFGVRSDATAGFDSRYDAPRPPKSPNKNFVEVGFPVNGESYPKMFGSSYARDYKSAEKPEWEFAVNTSGEGQVTLKWNKDAISALGSEVTINLYDATAHKLIDIKKVDAYTYEQNGTSRKFTLNDAEHAVPTSFQLAQNYPNPFNPMTTIGYGVPMDATVSVEVYNTLGQKVATLVSGEKVVAGYYEVNLDASQLSSGLYFYRISATGSNGVRFSESKKMLLLK